MAQSECIRPLTRDDQPAAAALAAMAPDPWRAEDIAGALAEKTRLCLAVTAETNGPPLGFACLRRVEPGLAELEMIVIAPGARGRGLGRALLAEALARLAPCRVLLEVRASNAAAIGLYEALGFRLLARRPGLYSHPVEDGLTMEYAPEQEGTASL